MRALLSTIGSRGDVQPLVALALELKALGEEVRLCVPPDFKDWIESLGIPVTPIGPEVRNAGAARRAATAPPAPPSPEQLRQVIEATVATQFETITAAARGCDLIVAATALQIAARSVAEVMGVPYVFAAYCPAVLPSPYHPPPTLPPAPGQTAAPASASNAELWARDAERFNATFGEALNSRRASLGLAAIANVRGYMFTDRPWLAADPALAPWPDPADEHVFQAGAWILPDERPLSSELERFLEAGEPPVYFGLGSTHAPRDISQVMVDSARALGRRSIVSRGWADLSVMDDDPDAFAVDEVNLHALFTRVAAVVHHGGAGTTTIAACAGVPQVVIPQVYDQHYWAQRIHALGIGTAHAPGAPSTDSLTNALRQTLLPEVAARARSLAAAVHRDGARTAALKLTSHARRRPSAAAP
jgi:vancomycin aglycone glucosyltransferase